MSSTGATPELREIVRSCLASRGIGPGSTVLVACSGGPDSTALLDAVCAVSATLALRVVCAYFDHGIRSARERSAERRAVEALAARLGVAVVVGGASPGALRLEASGRGASLEVVAREARYAFLERTADEAGAAVIAVGHTADDAAETVLMRVFEGADVSGLAGIPRSRGRVIRPLYDIRRADLIRYLEERDLASVVDSTNADPRYLRNRVRAEIIPAVARVFPSYRESLAALARKARATHDFVAREAERIDWRRCGEALRAPWEAFRSAEEVVRVAAAYAAFDRLGSGRVSHRLLEPLRRPLEPGKRGVILSGSGFRLARRGPWVYAEADVVRSRKIGYLVHVRTPGDYALAECGVRVTAQGGDVAPPRPVVVRSPRPGDGVRSRGRWISLERLAAGRHGEPGAWDLLPIVADCRGVLRVLGSAVGGTDTTADGDDGEASGAAGISVTVTVEEQ